MDIFVFSVMVPCHHAVLYNYGVYVDRERGSVQVSLVQSQFCLHCIGGRSAYVRLSQLLRGIPTSTPYYVLQQ